jgi:hypothetical protein
VPVERRNAEHAEIVELAHAVLGVLVQEVLEDRPGLGHEALHRERDAGVELRARACRP